MNKGTIQTWATVIILALLVVAVGTYYMGTKKVVTNQESKTYENDQFGFQFTYPDDSTKFAISEEGGWGTDACTSNLERGNWCQIVIIRSLPAQLFLTPAFVVDVQKQAADIKDIETLKQSLTKSVSGYKDSQQINFNGTDWLRVESAGDVETGDVISDDYYTVRGDFIFKIYRLNLDSKFDVYGEILRSFKFR